MTGEHDKSGVQESLPQQTIAAIKMGVLSVHSRCTCIAHVGLPGQLAPRVRGQVEGLKVLAAALQLPRQVALGCALCGPGPCCEHLHHAHSYGSAHCGLILAMSSV